MNACGSSIITTSRRYMSTIYDELSPTHNAWIVYPGQLVEIRRNCFEQLGELGIIIECACPNFGIGYDDEYWVFLNGELMRIKTFMIYPVNLH